MRNLNCLSIKHLFSVGLSLLFVTSAHAQYVTATAAENKVKSIKLETDSPMEINYVDGRVAQVVRRESVDNFRVPISLNENSCQDTVGLKCTLVVPYVRQQYAAVWKVHPTRQGQALEYSYNKNMTYGKQIGISRGQDELYENVLRRIQSSEASAALKYKSLARIECNQDIAPALPASRQILFWDENYENGNSELAMTHGTVFGARVNLIYRRHQDLNIDPQGKVMHIGRYRKGYGMVTDSYPIGLSYMVQMMFRSPSKETPADEVCSMKWDINFSEYFIQISALQINAANTPYNPTGFSVYKYNLENVNPYAQDVFKKETWEGQGMQ